MVCPFCGKEMDKGFVKGPPDRLFNGCLYWDSKPEMKLSEHFFKMKLPTLAVSHYDNNFPAIVSYKCDNCKKIIMDTYVENE